MEAKVAIIFFFFFFFAFSLQAMSSPITEKSDDVEGKKQSVLKELEKAVGLPNLAVGDHGEWTVRAVQFISEKMNWKYNFSGGEKPDPKDIEVATRRIVTAIGWILSDPQLNPYRSFTDWLASFTYLFNYLRDLEKGKLSGGFKNPVYKCYERFWPTCEARAPATLEGAVVYRFECGWEFSEQCLKYHITDGRQYEPDWQDRAVRPKPGGSYNRGCNKIFQCRPGK